MKFLKTFFGQVLRKQDVDFQNQGGREGSVSTHVDLTNRFGGVVDGLDTFKSIDNLTILITPGIFYSTGDISERNNLGGGERGKVYTTQSFSGLPETAPIGNEPSYLLVYAKVVTTNTNPDPTKFQTTVTAKNIQTGENVLTRDYPAGVIVVSNPIRITEINKFNGVPLAVLQVNYEGTAKNFSNGTITTIDTSYKRDYTIGGVVNVAKKSLVPEAILDDFLINRMFADNSISGNNLGDESVESIHIAPYDGSENITSTGLGVATGHLKDNAVEGSKISFISGLSDYTPRNYLLNSDFGKAPPTLANWEPTGTNMTGGEFELTDDPATTKFGTFAVKVRGGFTGDPDTDGLAETRSLSQRVNFRGPINGRPISAFFYAKPSTSFDLDISGTTGINGRLEFFNDFNATAPTSTIQFAGYSGLANGDFIKIASTGSIVIPETEPEVRAINFVVEGAFDNTVWVDGAFLGLSNITPGFAVAVEEQISQDLNANNIVAGTIRSEFLANGAVLTRHVRNSNGSVNLDATGYGIQGGAEGLFNPDLAGHIRSGTITNSNIANATIGGEKLQAGVASVPTGGILMFDDESIWFSAGNAGCPPDFDYISQFEGRFPLGRNTDPLSGIPNAGIGGDGGSEQRGDKIVGRVADAWIGDYNTNGGGAHTHGVRGGGPGFNGHVDTGGWVIAYWPDHGVGNHTHVNENQVPYRTVIFCRRR